MFVTGVLLWVLANCGRYTKEPALHDQPGLLECALWRERERERERSVASQSLRPKPISTTRERERERERERNRETEAVIRGRGRERERERERERVRGRETERERERERRTRDAHKGGSVSPHSRPQSVPLSLPLRPARSHPPRRLPPVLSAAQLRRAQREVCSVLRFDSSLRGVTIIVVV